jgi:hypothetical protein
LRGIHPQVRGGEAAGHFVENGQHDLPNDRHSQEESPPPKLFSRANTTKSGE